MPAKRSKASRGRRSHDKIDVTAIFTKPINVGKVGRQQRMTPFEVSLRALVKKAIKERSLNAINSVLEMALQFDLAIPPPPQPQNGGVRFIPLVLTKEQYVRYEEAKAKGIITPDDHLNIVLFEPGSPADGK